MQMRIDESIDMNEANDLVSGAFEACAKFSAGPAEQVCERCGWLDVEHADELRRFAASSPPSPASSRRASRAA
jgi:hypothetical protein